MASGSFERHQDAQCRSQNHRSPLSRYSRYRESSLTLVELNERAPINLVAVVDTSGSMRGEKLNLVQDRYEIVLWFVLSL